MHKNIFEVKVIILLNSVSLQKRYSVVERSILRAEIFVLQISGIELALVNIFAEQKIASQNNFISPHINRQGGCKEGYILDGWTEEGGGYVCQTRKTEENNIREAEVIEKNIIKGWRTFWVRMDIDNEVRLSIGKILDKFLV